MQAQDFLLGDDGELITDNGDFVVGVSDGQHIQHILEIEPGELKEDVLTGVGIKKQMNGVIDGNVRKEIQLQLQADGYAVGALQITEENITIDAQRNG